MSELILTLNAGSSDGWVFAAGIGENDATTRAHLCRDAAWLGIQIDPEANERRELKISVGDSTPSVWVIPTDEERMIAMHTVRLMRAASEGE